MKLNDERAFVIALLVLIYFFWEHSDNEVVTSQSTEVQAQLVETVDYRNEVKDFILLHEGGLSNHVADPGGWTNKGVTWSTYSRLAKRLNYSPSKEHFKAMPDSVWDGIYALHWDKFTGIRDVRIRAFCTDYLWGSGTTAIGNIQKVVKKHRPSQSTDRILGPKTIHNINMCQPDSLLKDLRNQRIAFLKGLPHSNYFYAGWKKRVDNLVLIVQDWNSPKYLAAR